jgi:hypothetical protein
MEGGTYTERIIGLHRTQSDVIAQAGHNDDFIDFLDVPEFPVNMDFITQSMRWR